MSNADTAPRLQRARSRDLPALALMLGRAMARRPYGAVAGWLLAVLGWPVWWVLLDQSMPHVWHLNRQAVATIAPPGAPRVAGVRRLGAVLTVAVPIGIATGTWPATIWMDLAIVTAFLLTYLGWYPGRLRAGPRVHHSNPPVIIGTVASSHPGSGILRATQGHVDRNYPSHSVETVARDSELVRLYARVGNLRQIIPGRGRMNGSVGPQILDGHKQE